MNPLHGVSRRLPIDAAEREREFAAHQERIMVPYGTKYQQGRRESIKSIMAALRECGVGDSTYRYGTCRGSFATAEKASGAGPAVHPR